MNEIPIAYAPVCQKLGVENGYMCYCLLGHLGLTCFIALSLLHTQQAGRLAANMLMDRAEPVDPRREEKAAADSVPILMLGALSCSVYVERIVHLDTINGTAWTSKEVGIRSMDYTKRTSRTSPRGVN